MVVAGKTPFSNDTLVGIFGIVAGICAYVLEGWATRAFFVFLAISLIVYAGRRHGSHPLVRYPVAIAAIWIFSFNPWGPIWLDFNKNYPDWLWASFITSDWFHWSLAIIASLILVWGWPPFWSFRRRVKFHWRSALGEETWINRTDANKLVRASDWAKIREPSLNIFEGVGKGLLGGMSPYDRDMLRYRRFINMTIESFERNHSDGVREVEGIKQYSEGTLRQFLENALDAEVIEKFGNIPR
jgi:hypothetical protein